jgi:hypothetical protein
MTTADTRRTLHLLRDHLGDLQAAMHTDPQPVWPPQRLTTEMWAARDQQAREERAERGSLALTDAPAPIANVTAMEAYQHVTEQLLTLADVVAAACQRPVRQALHDAEGHLSDEEVAAAELDAADPRRWHYNASWANGPHWAAVYVDGRLAGDDLGDPDDDLFRPLPGRLEPEVRRVATDCWHRTAAVLGIGDRTDVLPRPCPWCRQERLTLHQPVGEAPYVVCRTGWDCGAPARRDDRGRPLWIGGEMAHLHTALEQRERTGGAA